MRHQRDEETADQRVAKLVRGRHGVVTRTELIAAGLTPSGISRRVQSCRLQSLYRGVYFAGAAPVPPRARWLAAVLSCGPDAVLSHESAAALWGIGPVLVSPVHVTIPAPGNRRSRRGLHVHRSTTLAAGDVTTRDGIPVTAPLRTLADLPAAARDRASSAALVAGLVDSLPGRSRLRSGAERRFLRLCRGHDLPRPEVNVTVEGFERDFVWRQQRLVVEVDGPHHDHEPQQASDRRRDRSLARAGWTVVRYGAAEVYDRPTHVARELGALLTTARR